jgi:acetyl/propionyl-CoA carboxylase alpha subunit
MALTYTVTRQISVQGGTAYAFSKSVSSGLGTVIEEAIDAGQTNKQVDITIDQSQMKAFLLATDQDCTIVAKNGAGDTINTWTMTANQAIAWEYGNAITCPLSGDITRLLVTNTPALTLTCVVLTDPTA